MHLDSREQGLQQISGLRRAKSDDTRRVRALRPNSLDPSFSLDRSSNQRDKINRLSQLVDVQPGHEVEPRRFLLKHQRINGVQITLYSETCMSERCKLHPGFPGESLLEPVSVLLESPVLVVGPEKIDDDEDSG